MFPTALTNINFASAFFQVLNYNYLKDKRSHALIDVNSPKILIVFSP